MKPMFRTPLSVDVRLTTTPDAGPVPDVVPTQPSLAPGEAGLLRRLVEAGGTATTMQLHQASAVRTQELFAHAVSLSALGLVMLQQHPLLPNHATLRVTPFGRRVSADATDSPDRDLTASGERHLRLVPDAPAPANDPRD